MTISPAQLDRARGVLVGTAVGDALGVPYEFDSIPLPADGEYPQMLGGGLGGFAPGEWSDDTSMAVAIAEVAATGADLRSDDAIGEIARGFLRWFAGNPPDVGVQTGSVLGATRRRRDAGESDPGAIMLDESATFTAAHPHSAGNGALMRTAVVALAHLDDRIALAEAARLVASLTHADELAGDSCVLWCDAIRVAVLDAQIDIRAGLDLLPGDRRTQWAEWLDMAARDDPKSFTPNGFTVIALQAAASAICHTAVPDADPAEHFRESLYTAVGIGNDTDTVAAITGGLLGARWGVSAIPDEWRQKVHGWPTSGGQPSTAVHLVGLVDSAVAGASDLTRIPL